jgi:predicted SnoaL-like aldol condensation-catalyzing enzyme
MCLCLIICISVILIIIYFLFFKRHDLSNTELLKIVYKGLFKNRDMSIFNKYYKRNLIQHEPSMPNGVEAIKSLILKARNWKTYRIISENNLIVSQSSVDGWAPNTMIVFDIFLVKNQKLVEHWGLMTQKTDPNPSGRTQTDGTTTIIDLNKTKRNKQIAIEFFKDILRDHNMDLINNYLSPKYMQHNSHVADGIPEFLQAVKQFELQYFKLWRIIAQGNFVFLHSEGSLKNVDTAFGDLLRIENGKIIEHWDITQKVIPKEESENCHDMFSQLTRI